MTGKERIHNLLEGRPADRAGFWLGNPLSETKSIYAEHLGLADGPSLDIELNTTFGSDFFWCSPEIDPLGWKHPEGKSMFDFLGGNERTSLGQPGIFADCEDPLEVERYTWPNPDYLDFSSTIETIENASARGMAIFGGMWMPFFHIVAAYLGMENYFMKMHTHPKVVEAITEKVLEFYLEANARCLDAMGSKLDAVFFGNDLGSQRGLLISPGAFEKFVLPGYKRIVEQAKRYRLKVVLHSCGAVAQLIPKLIEIGIDGLHPLQARAKGMEAESLARDFNGELLFIGGVDTQQLLPHGTPTEVRNEVRRLKDLFGERYVVSPSHEALLPNVCIDNVIAMRDATLESSQGPFETL